MHEYKALPYTTAMASQSKPYIYINRLDLYVLAFEFTSMLECVETLETLRLETLFRGSIHIMRSNRYENVFNSIVYKVSPQDSDQGPAIHVYID